jgi:hypothetical protein
MSRHQEENTSPAVEADRQIATIIARYTVEPQQQSTLIHQLQQHHNQHLQLASWWHSTSLLRGMEGTRVVAYFQVKKADDNATVLMNSLETIGSPYAASDVHLYTVDWIAKNGNHANPPNSSNG